MALLRILLLALIVLLNHSVAAARSVHTCCFEADCPVSACVAMGCLPATVPPLAGVASAPPLPPPGDCTPHAAPPSVHYSAPFDSIWRPPR